MDRLRTKQIKELKAFLKDNELVIEKFDGNLLWRLIKKMKVTFLVEVAFIFKSGVEVKEII